jgi:hypothetical protein
VTAFIDKIIKPREKDLGDGFVVRRILPFHAQKMVGPFIFFDHFGPVNYAPGKGFDVRPHPHIGLATVTFLYEGAIRHKDMLGNDLVIRPGAVNWMTAGRGISHSERTPDEERASGQSMHGIQTWVALPEDLQEIEPDFVHHPAETLPEFDLGGAKARVLAGKAFGHESPVEYPHPIWYVGADAPEGATFVISKDECEERALYVADGQALIDGTEIEAGQMAILTPSIDVPVSVTPDTRFMLAGGAPMDGPRKIDWNFVSTDRARIEQAKADWRASIAGNWKETPFGMPPGESDYIPLPGED